jgi:hypothetical protein
VQECKKSKVEMYKLIYGLVFKCNGSRRKNILIQFSQEYSNLRNEKKKDQIRTQDVIEFGLKCLRFQDSQPLTIEVEPKH